MLNEALGGVVMSLSVIVRALVSSGATPEMILAVVEAHEGEATKAIDARRANDAERQRKVRLARSCHVTSRDVTVTSVTELAKEIPPIPPKENIYPSPPKGGTSQKKQACRFENSGITNLPTEWQTFAKSKNLSDSQAAREFEKFQNYWTAKSGGAAAKLDWAATWRNWILDVFERSGIRPAETENKSIPVSEWTNDRWKKAIGLALQAGSWQEKWGPPPDDPKTICPKELRNLWTRKAP